MASVKVSGGGLLEKDVQTISSGRQTGIYTSVVSGRIILSLWVLEVIIIAISMLLPLFGFLL